MLGIYGEELTNMTVSHVDDKGNYFKNQNIKSILDGGVNAASVIYKRHVASHPRNVPHRRFFRSTKKMHV